MEETSESEIGVVERGRGAEVKRVFSRKSKRKELQRWRTDRGAQSKKFESNDPAATSHSFICPQRGDELRINLEDFGSKFPSDYEEATSKASPRVIDPMNTFTRRSDRMSESGPLPRLKLMKGCSEK